MIPFDFDLSNQFNDTGLANDSLAHNATVIIARGGVWYNDGVYTYCALDVHADSCSIGKFLKFRLSYVQVCGSFDDNGDNVNYGIQDWTFNFNCPEETKDFDVLVRDFVLDKFKAWHEFWHAWCPFLMTMLVIFLLTIAYLAFCYYKGVSLRKFVQVKV